MNKYVEIEPPSNDGAFHNPSGEITSFQSDVQRFDLLLTITDKIICGSKPIELTNKHQLGLVLSISVLNADDGPHFMSTMLYLSSLGKNKIQ